MSNTLKARVRVDAKQALHALNQIERKIKSINNIVNQTNKTTKTLTNQMKQVGTAGTKAGNDITRSFRNSRREVTELSNGLNRVIGLYAMLSGMGTMITTSDAMTSAQNKLNYLNSELLGENGMTTDASGNKTYSNATLNATQEQMDKEIARTKEVGYTIEGKKLKFENADLLDYTIVAVDSNRVVLDRLCNTGDWASGNLPGDL